MFHRYYSTGFTTLIFKDKKHYEDCVNEYERLSGGKRKILATALDDYNGNVFNGVRYMNQEELEKCQTVPSGYTKCLTRNEAADVLGDGWTIDVITHIFSFMNN
jgi:DNA (cytosine-5)-methyltransferase 3A